MLLGFSLERLGLKLDNKKNDLWGCLLENCISCVRKNCFWGILGLDSIFYLLCSRSVDKNKKPILYGLTSTYAVSALVFII